jgi:hypothetical protein
VEEEVAAAISEEQRLVKSEGGWKERISGDASVSSLCVGDGL